VKALLALPAVAAAAVGMSSFRSPAGAPDPSAQQSLGAQLYATQCAGCHGVDGEGVEDRGPGLVAEGPAAVDFVLRTGRMPLATPNVQPVRAPVRYSEEEIVALVEYAGSFGIGPDIPVVEAGDIARGGTLFRLNCAACHVASGAGAAIGGGREAPSLMPSSPTEIGEAILIGPGAMPVFGTFTAQDIDDVAAYIRDLQERETTSVPDFGGAGPVAEGLAAWLLGLLPIIAITRWVGSPHEGRDRPVEAAVAAHAEAEHDG
jgi:ubiquinol-cytochrome c reductase cytochrome c subunit